MQQREQKKKKNLEVSFLCMRLFESAVNFYFIFGEAKLANQGQIQFLKSFTFKSHWTDGHLF